MLVVTRDAERRRASRIELHVLLVQHDTCKLGRFRTLPGLIRCEQKRLIRKLDLRLTEGSVEVEGLKAILCVFHSIAEQAPSHAVRAGEETRERREAGRWEIREDEARWVREMYRLASQGWTLSAIGRWLTAQGAKTRKGGQWWPKTILGILSNPINYGCLASRRVTVRAQRPYQPRPTRPSTGKAGVKRRQVKTSWKLLPAGSWRGPTLRPELAIVTKEAFDQAAQARRKNAQTSPRTKKLSLLHGLVVCGCHPDMMHRMYYSARDGRPPVWRCPYRAGIDAPYCTSYVRADRLDQAVWGRLVALATEPDALLKDMVKRLALHSAQADKAQRRTSAAQALVQAAEDKLDRIAIDYYDGAIERDQYERLRRHYEGQKAEALRARASAKEEAARWTEHPLAAINVDKGGLVAAHVADVQGHAAQVVRQLIHAALGDPVTQELEALPLDERRRRIKGLVEQVLVDQEGVSLVCALTGRRDQLDGCYRYSASGARGRMDRPMSPASSA